MTAARHLARSGRNIVVAVALLALFTAGIATAMAAGQRSGPHRGYWTVRSLNPQLAVNRLLEEPATGTCADVQAALRDARIDVQGNGVAVGTFSIAEGCNHVTVELASYITPLAGFSLPQVLFESAHGIFDAGGPYDLTVHLPPCAPDGEGQGFQVNLTHGDAAPGVVTADNLFHVAAAVNGGLPPCQPSSTSTGEHSTTETHPTSTETETEPTTTFTHPTTTTTTHTTTTTTTTTTTPHTTTTTPTTETVPPPAPTVDVAVTKLANVASATVGDQITYVLTVRNNGPASATNVVVVDDLPSEVTLVSASPTQGSCTGTDPVRCSLGTLAAGGSATVTIVVRAASQGTAVNSATVSSTEPDTNPANNAAQAIVAIGAFIPPVCPSLSLVFSPRSAVVGRPITVVAHVRDQNGSGVAGVRVTIRGGGIDLAKSSDSSGRAEFRFIPRRTGVIQASIPATANCTGRVSGLVHVLGAFRPPRPKVTG